MMTAELTGLRNADELIAYARAQGLDVTIKTDTEPARPLAAGLELPGFTSVSVRITIPCPERLAGTFLGVDIRAECLMVNFHKSDRKRARAKFLGATRSRLGSSRDIKVLRRAHWEVEWMGQDARRYQKIAKEK